MTRDHEENASEENVTVRSIVLMSTLAAAADVAQGMSERRRGQDPSGQEELDVAATFVRAASIDLQEHLLALQASRVLSESGDPDRSVLISRRMNEVMILNYIARLLHVMHQRVMSLYPAVSEELVEETRILHNECVALRDHDDPSSLGGFVTQTQRFCCSLRRAV